MVLARESRVQHPRGDPGAHRHHQRDGARRADLLASCGARCCERLEGHLFVAHNARFDYGFLKNEFRRLEMPFTADVLCTVRLSRRLYPEAVGHGLDAVDRAPRLGGCVRGATPQSRTGRHSALGDARVLWRFVQLLYHETRSARDRARRCGACSRSRACRRSFRPTCSRTCPKGPGVYRFYGVNDLPIYIGKSVNLRDRVRSHFSSDYRSANDIRISSEIQRIEVEETAGELGALLREARLVKELLPLHNHRLRRKLNACFVRLPRPALAAGDPANKDIDWGDARPPSAETLYGPFADEAAREAAARGARAASTACAGACLGWEKRGGPCFARQVRKCRGACIGEETPRAAQPAPRDRARALIASPTGRGRDAS